jgi:hypothetical protein
LVNSKTFLISVKMPNTCYNFITFSGNSEQLKHFMNNWWYPEECFECPRVSEYTLLLEEEDKCVFEVQTGGVPPTGWAQSMGLKPEYSELEIKIVFWEIGAGFYGYSYTKGKKHKEITYQVDFEEDYENIEEKGDYIFKKNSMMYFFMERNGVFQYYDEYLYKR